MKATFQCALAALIVMIGADLAEADVHSRNGKLHASLDAVYSTDRRANFYSAGGSGLRRKKEEEARPTQQPHSRGQDEGHCGVLELPSDLFLVPRVSDEMTRHGCWETSDGATYVEWTQDLFAWQYETVYFYADSKLFLKAEVIENEEVQLPSVKLQNAQKNENKFYTIALKDCDDTLLYILRETKGDHNVYEIFNRADERVAWSEMGSLFVDQLHFYDDENKPIAIAQSPKVMQDTYKMIDDRADPYFGNVPTWEIQFLKGYNSSSELVQVDPAKEGCQKCWVIAAAVQERAIRNSMRGPDGRVKEPEAFPWFVGLLIFFLAVLVAACGYFLYWVFRLVYPKSYNEVENKFLMSNKSIYGDLQPKLDVAQPGSYGTYNQMR